MKRDTRYYQQHGLLRIFLSYFGPHRRLFLLDMLCALFIGRGRSHLPAYLPPCDQHDAA